MSSFQVTPQVLKASITKYHHKDTGVKITVRKKPTISPYSKTFVAKSEEDKLVNDLLVKFWYSRNQVVSLTQ
jgi:hypothetical protein